MGKLRKELSNLEDSVKDVGRSIDNAVFQPVKEVGRKIDDEILQPVKNTVEAIVEDPKKLAAVAIAVAFPGAGAFLGAQLGITSAALAQVVGQTIINTALNGGDVKSAVISAALPVVGQAGASALSSTLASSGIEGAVNTVITRAVTQGTTAAILGKDPLSAALLGGVTAGVNAIVPDIPGYNDLPPAAKNAISSAIATKLTGGDLGGAVSQSLVNDAISWAKSEVSKLPDALKTAAETWKADTGATLSDEEAALLFGRFGADDMAAAADRFTTSEQEARDIWLSTVGTEPTEFDLMRILGLEEDLAYSEAASYAKTLAETPVEPVGPPTQEEQQPSVEDLIRNLEATQPPEPEPEPAGPPPQEEQQSSVDDLIRELEATQPPEPPPEPVPEDDTPEMVITAPRPDSGGELDFESDIPPSDPLEELLSKPQDEMTPEDWAKLYGTPTTNPETGETVTGADPADFPNQDFGVEPVVPDDFTGEGPALWEPNEDGTSTMTSDDGGTITIDSGGNVVGVTDAPAGNLPEETPPTPPKPPTTTVVPAAPNNPPAQPPTPPGTDMASLLSLLGMVGGGQQGAVAAPPQPQVVEAGSAFDISDAFDTGFFGRAQAKKEQQKQQQPTKIAAGGYIDDLLAEGMSVDDLITLLR
jgi:hypothetical protein